MKPCTCGWLRPMVAVGFPEETPVAAEHYVIAVQCPQCGFVHQYPQIPIAKARGTRADFAKAVPKAEKPS